MTATYILGQDGFTSKINVRNRVRKSRTATASSVQLVRWDMSYDLGWCSTHFSGEKLKATAHVSANELYM
jgi:hypothetical protein